MSRRRLLVVAVLALIVVAVGAGLWYRRPRPSRLERARSIIDPSWRTVTIAPYGMSARVPTEVTCVDAGGRTRCEGGALDLSWQVDAPSERTPRPVDADPGEGPDPNIIKEPTGSPVWLGDDVMLGFRGHWVYHAATRAKVYSFYFEGWKELPGRGLARLMIHSEGMLADRDPSLGLAILLSTSAPAGTEPVWFPEPAR